MNAETYLVRWRESCEAGATPARDLVERLLVSCWDSKHLNLRGGTRGVAMADAELAVVFTLLENDLHWESVDASYQPLGPASMDALTRALSLNSNLKSLNIGWTDGSPDDMATLISNGLSACTSLESLNFSHIPLGRSSGLALASIAQKPSTRWRELILANTCLPGEVVTAFATVLADRRSGCGGYLEVLDLSGSKLNSLGGESIRHLGEALKASSALRELSLGNTGLGVEGLRYIMNGAAQNSQLSKLNLAKNNFGPDAGDVLAEYFSRTGGGYLSYLNCSATRLGDEGAVALARGMMSGSLVLKELDLSFAGVAGRGLMALAETIRMASGGTDCELSVKLWGNKWSPASMKAWHGLVPERDGEAGLLAGSDVMLYSVDGEFQTAQTA